MIAAHGKRKFIKEREREREREKAKKKTLPSEAANLSLKRMIQGDSTPSFRGTAASLRRQQRSGSA